MRNRTVLALAFFFFLVLESGTLRGAEQSPFRDPNEDPTGTGGALKGQIQTGGSYSAYSGGGTRIVRDLSVPDAPGEYGLDFTRYWNSTHNDINEPNAEWPQLFGSSGWSHSWHWRAELVGYSESLGDGEEELFHTQIIITFPDGHTTKYKIVRSNHGHGIPGYPGGVAPADPRLGPDYTTPEIQDCWPDGGMGVHDHISEMHPEGLHFWLRRADGGAVYFLWHQTLGYQAKEVYDPHGFKTTLNYNIYGDLDQVIQEGGRSLNITWGLFPGNWRVITRVEVGGTGGAQAVNYKYKQLAPVSNAFLVLSKVIYPNDQAPGQDNSALYVYGFDYAPNVSHSADAPMLKYADDPRVSGPMTKIAYDYNGFGCAPPAPYPWNYPMFVPAQPYAIAAEKSGETGEIVSRFSLYCQNGEREEINGLGGRRKFYFGPSAQTAEPAPSPNNLFCRGYQLGKVTDFTNAGSITAGHPCPAGVPCHRQNFDSADPRHIWDGRNIMTDERAAPGAADASGLPAEIHHPDGSVALHNRVDSSGSDGLDTSRMHNPHNHWLFRKTDERGHTTFYRRDARRRVKQIDYPDGSHEYFTYNDLNQVLTHTLPSGAVQTSVYDGNHRLIRESNSVDIAISPLDYKEYTYYGPSNHPEWTGLVETMTDGRARVSGAPFTVRMTYNGRYAVKTVEYASTNGNYPTVQYEYDKYGNCTAIIDELGHRKDYTYDSYRRCTSLVEQVNGNGPNCSNLPSRRWDWIYDRWIDGVGGRPASAHTSKEWRVQVDPIFNDLGERRVTARNHDVNNRITKEQTGWIQRPAPAALGDWYDGPDLETRSFTYDGNGQKSSSRDARNRETTYQYNNRNRLTVTTEYPIPGDASPPRTTQTFYNATGDKTKVIFPDNTEQEWPDANYDAFGQPHVFIDERDNVTNLDYWPWGPMKKLAQVTTHRSKDEGGTEDQLTAFFPDLLGRPWRTHFPDGSYEENIYKFGQVESWTNRRGGKKVIDQYDARGRETHHFWLKPDGITLDPATPAITRAWDAANRLTDISNVFSTIDYGYDAAGQMKWEATHIAGSGGWAEISYCRYPSGEVARLNYPNGTSVQRFYTGRGQLKDVGWGAGATSYTYLPDGKVNSQTRTNGVTTSYGYDGRGMIDSLRHTTGGHDLAKREYWRDGRDRIVAWKRGTDNHFNGMEDGRGNRYGYDAEGQLTTASYRAFNPETATPSGAVRMDSFQYDQLGNRKDQNHVANRGQWMTILRRNNGLNQYREWANNYPNPPEHWGSGIFHDDQFGSPGVPPGNGDVTAEGYLTAEYNALNQPVGMWSKAYVGTTNYLWFGYDPMGRCVKRWKGPSSTGTPGYAYATYFYFDGWSIVQEGPSAAITDRTYVHGGRIDEIVASQVSGVWYNHHYDAQGNAILLSTATGGLQEQYDYDAFGWPYFYNATGGKGGNPKTRFLFTGREWISDMRLYDYRHRMYQPELGRFLQPDPIQFKAGDYNLYRYCHNDPVNKTDPDGLKDEGVNDEIKKRGVDAAEGVGSYIRGIGRGVNALAGLSGIKGDQAKAEQQQAMADIFGVGKKALDEPKVAAKITAEGLKQKIQNKPAQIVGRALTGALAGKIPVPVGGGYAVPLGLITTPLAVYGDAAHMAVTVRQVGQTLGPEHVLDSILTGGTK